jgi:hypothetical protein
MTKMVNRLVSAGLAAFVLLLGPMPAKAVVISESDFTQGLANQTIQGINFSASGGTFDHKTVASVTGVGVSSGPSGGEIDLGQAINGSASSVNVGSITLGFLFDGPEFNDVNEVAQIVIDGTTYFLTATSDVTALWTGPGSVTNLSPATGSDAAVWLLSGLNFIDVQTLSLSAMPGVCGSAGGNCTNQSDFSLIQLTTFDVPEPANLTMLAAGLLGIGWVRRRRRDT